MGAHLAVTAGEDRTGSLVFGAVYPRRRVLHGQQRQLTGGVPTVSSVSWKGPWVPFPCRLHSAAPGSSREPSSLWRVEGGGRLCIGQVLSQRQLLLLLGRQFWCYC